ncbi:MAG: methanogenesis marker 8 protein [Halobacteriota archaeon]|nr:methanogenesis marker 8 protein [Halobacteriota archaeon]
MDRHIIETIGKTKVVVEDGKVVEVEDPPEGLEYCYVVHSISNFVKASSIEKMMPSLPRLGVEMRIKQWGMCTDERMIESEDDGIDFGVSEITSCAIRSKLLDAAVVACDGAGTVMASDPKVVQGIGKAMSGLVETSPLQGVISRLKERGCIILDEDNASMDQVQGLKMAFDNGWEKVGVTLADLDTAKRCREVEEEAGKTAVLIGVHTTGMSADDAEEFLKTVDITTACASKYLREFAGKYAILQLGVAIPIFAISEVGREILLNRVKCMKKQVLIKTIDLPELPEDRQPRPLL